MPRVAFYAPMKPPSHPVPSGDRAFARALMAAIATGDTEVSLVSTVQTHDSKGNAARQTKLRAAAMSDAARLIDQLAVDPPDLWVTYHNYYKAPDFIGHAVTSALGMPYIQIEASRAKKRLTGPWGAFAAAAESAIDAADVVFCLTDHDLTALERHRPPGQRLINLRPFLPRSALPAATDPARHLPKMLTAGMMRHGDKLGSYQIIADTLANLQGTDWQLDVAGDGPARAEVERLMEPFGNQVRFLGQLDAEQMARAYANAALFFWPGVNEGFGMVYLEAQAAGLPVVAQDRPGVRDVLAPGTYPLPEDGATALASQITRLLCDADLCREIGATARHTIARDHLIGSARYTFWSAVTPLMERIS
ncbi:glycosyltransferase family 4 protein [Sedimentitalea todarodis]|uniref:Glycosyltransferase family 4 protein n=1 Tax=Sedimentitalea todarodis TaxID=1631240 RepID=A0ABU3V7Z2_9RHOB|nr:glycosyltransferase family 4 protein [Sedimentitalea todarodis]MDU9002295.1 glycosyltransferase family 4 protein [Sedimentitalea todarodis]